MPQRLDTVHVAGRCASMTHDGRSSARVSGPCSAMGQAAAHLARSAGVPTGGGDVGRLPDRIEADGAYLGAAW